MAAGLLDLDAPVEAARGLGATEADILDLDQPTVAGQGILDLDALPPEPPSFLRHAAAFGARVVPPLVGAAAGALLGPAGALAGAAAGGALGEMAGRAIGGQEQAVLPTVAAGALSIIPGIRTASIPLRALEGAAQGVIATAAMTLAEGHGVPGPGELAIGAGAGAGLGLLLRRAFDGKGYWFKPTAKPPVAAEEAAATLKAADEAQFQARKAREFSEADRLQAAERSAIETELSMELALPEPGRMEPPEHAPRFRGEELPPGIPRVPGLEHFGQPPVGPVEAGGMPGLGPRERSVPRAPLTPPFVVTGAEQFPVAPQGLPGSRRIFGGGPLEQGPTTPSGPGALGGDLTRPFVGIKPAIGEQGGPLVVPPSFINPNVFDLTAEAALLRDIPLREALPAALRGDHSAAMDALEAGVRAGVTRPEDVAAIRALTGQPPPRLTTEPIVPAEILTPGQAAVADMRRSLAERDLRKVLGREPTPGEVETVLTNDLASRALDQRLLKEGHIEVDLEHPLGPQIRSKIRNCQ